MCRILIVMLSYLAGTIPFGVVCSRLFKLGDVRKMGSGNIGATNVLRTGCYSAACLTLVGDFAKGFVPVFISRPDNLWWTSIVAIFAVIGHVFPLWSRFRGGKGVATTAGALCALEPLAFAIGLCAWLGTFFFTRISSLAALVSTCFVLPIYAVVRVLYAQSAYSILFFAFAAAALIAFTHRSNIKRLVNHEEIPVILK
ncbi:MAG: glycerol-3-phosphate 1-O-acyltransferase PlsY [Holosporales bacterium]|jgi:glycerol-3-phosphate acyltransferase PlsY|nr:glycerol-3-phosphate 1-O-acyltransferase PlsY [Holosporales bacterium]